MYSNILLRPFIVMWLLIGLMMPSTFAMQRSSGLANDHQPSFASRPAYSTQTLLFQNGVSPTAAYTGTADAIITTWSGNSTANLGGLEYLQVGETGDVDEFRFLIRFELGDWLPSGARMTEAWLEIRSYDGGFDDSSQDAVVHRVSQAWVEGDGRDLFGDGRAQGVTWVTARPGVTWATPGGDFAATELDRVSVAANATDWQRWDVTAAVQAWLADPAANFGLLLEPDAAPWVHHEFRSSEYATPELRPRLRISYTLGVIYLPLILHIAAVSLPTATPTPLPSPTQTSRIISMVTVPFSRQGKRPWGGTVLCGEAQADGRPGNFPPGLPHLSTGTFAAPFTGTTTLHA